ncbi:MAG: glutaredoxin domain-containing protein [Pseudohongiellaceae bacterium]|nr:glutaredoxin domain-containing protein [Pseudohongiellaceae bacterium]
MTIDLQNTDSHSSNSFVDEAINNSNTPVVLFSLGWCSFCRALKQLLDSLQVHYKVYELDQGEFLEPQLQRSTRARLRELGNSGTLPQLFVATQPMGGYTDVLAAAQRGALQDLLTKHNIPFGSTAEARH